VRPRSESPASESSRLDCDLSLRRSEAATFSERRPLDAGDTLTCKYGVEVRIRTLTSWLPPCEICTGHSCKELRGVEDREDS
jgi:hypothetical protein